MIDRIRALLALRQLTPTQFADLIQVGRPIVSHILSGRNKASLDVVQRIIAAFPEVSLPWLLSGTGTMLTELAPVAAAIASPSASLVALNPPVASLESDLAPKPPEKVPRATMKSFRLDVGEARIVAGPLSEATSIASAGSRHPPQRFKVDAPKTKVATSNQEEVVAVSQSPYPGVAAMPPVQLEGGNAATPEPSLYAARPAAANRPQADLMAMPEAPIVSTHVVGSSADGESASALRTVRAAPVLPPVISLPDALTVAPGMNEKLIRRIVIFYRDGSFSDFQPES